MAHETCVAITFYWAGPSQDFTCGGGMVDGNQEQGLLRSEPLALEFPHHAGLLGV